MQLFLAPGVKFRKTKLALISATLVSILGCSQEAEQILNFDSLQQNALSAMGAESLQRIEYTANGWEACLGQPWNIEQGWARWEILDYNRVIDYSTTNSYQTAQRRAGLDPERLGGCGAQPNATASGQQSSISESSNWTQQLQLWLTPQGFLNLAAGQNASVDNTDDGYQLSFSVTQEGVEYELSGYYSDDFLLQRIDTWIDDSVFGDMLMQAEFSDYQSFDGVMFPGSIVQKQGGHSVLELEVDGFIANTTSAAEAPLREGGGFGGGPPQAQNENPVTTIGEGVYVLSGAYQSVVVEFDDYLVVIDGLQNDARANEIVRLAKETVPGKPIAYVINTHLHFDHASGLREFVAEGATIVTHQMNADFFRTALSAPRTLNTQWASTEGMTISVEGVGDEFIIEDGSQRIELHRLHGSSHADDMLIAYIPSIKTIVEADVLQPWINPVFAGNGGPHPFLVHLASELERLGIDYEQFVPVHRPTPAPTMTRADLMAAIQQ